MEIWMIVALVILAVVYAVVATCLFLNDLLVNSFGAAFGWPSASVLTCLVAALLWPILLPIGIIWAWIEG